MKKDIVFPPVVGVSIAIAHGENEEESLWQVILINDNEHAIESITISSKGYGELDGKPVETSVLRHFFAILDGKSFQAVELIDPNVFKLYNEYWVSYFIGKQLYDKKFVFVPESIIPKNLTFIPLLKKEGILHS